MKRDWSLGEFGKRLNFKPRTVFGSHLLSLPFAFSLSLPSYFGLPLAIARSYGFIDQCSLGGSTLRSSNKFSFFGLLDGYQNSDQTDVGVIYGCVWNSGKERNGKE